MIQPDFVQNRLRCVRKVGAASASSRDSSQAIAPPSLPVSDPAGVQGAHKAAATAEEGVEGPWLVERLIGMREFPRALDCDGKATMLEDCVRRACQTPGGDVDMDIHKHVREETRAWCSDGADLGVPLAATATFPHLAFHGWDESHSAQALLKHSIKEDAEITTTDSLLVTRKKPPSLAKLSLIHI